MTKKLTITVSDEVYDGLRQRVGPRKISSLIDRLARSHLAKNGPERWLSASPEKLDAAYTEQAAYEDSPGFAEERATTDHWLDGLMGDALDEGKSDQTR